LPPSGGVFVLRHLEGKKANDNLDPTHEYVGDPVGNPQNLQ